MGRKAKKTSEDPLRRKCGSLFQLRTPLPYYRATIPAVIERPKMSMAMWAALKNHIMRQRERKKEQEAGAATERVRREQELKRRQETMTLEVIRDQVQQSEKKLVTLKEEKHQLFMQLKKVLQEDDARKRTLVKEASKMAALNHSYRQQQHHNAMQQRAATAAAAAAVAPQNLYIPEMNQAHSMYMMTQPIPQNPSVLHRAPLKRPLTSSLPPPSSKVASSSSKQPTPPQFGFSPQQPYAYMAQIPGSANGAPKLIPQYAPNHGPIHYAHVLGQGAMFAMAPAAPVPYPAYPKAQFPHHHEFAAPAVVAATVAKQQQIVATHNFYLAHQLQQATTAAQAQQQQAAAAASGTAQQRQQQQQASAAAGGYYGGPVVPQPLEHGLQKQRFHHEERFYMTQSSMLPMRTLASPAQSEAALALVRPKPKSSSYAVQQHHRSGPQRHPGCPGEPTRFY